MAEKSIQRLWYVRFCPISTRRQMEALVRERHPGGVHVEGRDGFDPRVCRSVRLHPRAAVRSVTRLRDSEQGQASASTGRPPSEGCGPPRAGGRQTFRRSSWPRRRRPQDRARGLGPDRCARRRAVGVASARRVLGPAIHAAARSGGVAGLQPDPGRVIDRGGCSFGGAGARTALSVIERVDDGELGLRAA